MSPKVPISPPAHYVTPAAVGFADSAGDLSLVSASEPLPVTLSRDAANAPLEGLSAASGLVGPFAAVPDVPIHLQLQGEWTGTVALQRSTDGGASAEGLTASGMPWARFTENANEVVWQESERGVTFYLAIELTDGTVGYRLSQ